MFEPMLTSKFRSQRSILAALLRTAEEKKQICLCRRWKYKKSNGEEIILRDLMEKIIVWVDRFKQIGDNVVQYDPVHAALPWAGVRLILQVSG